MKKIVSIVCVLALSFCFIGINATDVKAAIPGSCGVSTYKVYSSGTSTLLNTITKGKSVDIVVTIVDSRDDLIKSSGNLSAVILKGADAFSATSVDNISINHSTNEIVTFDITFSKITYNGSLRNLDFTISYLYLGGVENGKPTSVGQTVISLPISQAEIYIAPTSEITPPTSSSQPEQSKPQVAPPIIILKSFDYGGDGVGAGDEFILDIVASNTNAATAIEELLVSLTLPPEIVMSRGNSSYYFQSIAPKGNISTRFFLQVKSGAVTNPYSISVGYKGYFRNESLQLVDVSATHNISVSVYERERFAISKVDMPTSAFVGEEQILTISLVNKGKSVVGNISAEIAGNIATPGQQQWVGNLAAGAETSIDFYIGGIEPGEASGVITIHYEDVSETEKTLTQNYTVTVEEQMYQDSKPMPEPLPAKQGGGGNVVLYVAIVIVAAGVAGTIILWRLKKKKMQKAEEEQDEDA